MKQYTVYYKNWIRGGYLSTKVKASTEDEALELAHKQTLIYKKYLTTKKPESP